MEGHLQAGDACASLVTLSVQPTAWHGMQAAACAARKRSDCAASDVDAVRIMLASQCWQLTMASCNNAELPRLTLYVASVPGNLQAVNTEAKSC